MPAVTKAPNVKGDFLVDYEEKVFEDVKADPGEKALVTFHTVAFEGSIGFVSKQTISIIIAFILITGSYVLGLTPGHSASVSALTAFGGFAPHGALSVLA